MEKHNTIGIPRHLKRIQPRYVIIISLLLIITLFLSALYELTNTKREIHHIMEEEAATLMEAVSISGANAIQSFHEIEKLVEEKLFSAAHLVDRLDRKNMLSQQELIAIAIENRIYRINIFNSRGEKVLAGSQAGHDSLSGHRPQLNYIRPILEGHVDEIVIGLKESQHPGEKRFAVAIKRSKGGVIVVNVDAKSMLDFRKSIGVGRLIQDIAEYEGIDYIVLQDREGLIIASKGLGRINSVNGDSFLLEALAQDTMSSRMFQIADHKIFEFVRPFILYDEPVGLLRIGLKTNHLKQAEVRIKRRLIIMSFVMGLFILIVLNFLTMNQNYRLINEAYRRIQTYSSNILEHMADAVIAIDRDKRITLFNYAATQLFKLPTEQVMNKTCRKEIKAGIPPLQQALEEGVTVKDLEKPIKLDNHQLITSISTSVLKNANGEIDSAFAVIKDLTEKRSLEENLQRKEKLSAMGQLASGLAHEIRNPLNAIGMITQRFNKEFEPTQDAEEYHQLTKTVVSEVRRINEIIQQFLKFARPPKLNLSRTNIIKLIESIILLVNAQAQQKGVEISKTLNTIPQLLIDQNQVKQALLNLMQNSIEAIEGEGQIQVRTDVSDNNEVIIEIADSGIGMDKATISKIFNLYFTTKPSGTGLGLSMVHQIISQHNGRIEVESEVGKGAKFLIYLPL